MLRPLSIAGCNGLAATPAGRPQQPRRTVGPETPFNLVYEVRR
jgi:hypothetical protein